MTSGGKSLYRQQPKEDDLQRPHSVRNLVIGTGVLGAITIICWWGTGASQSGNSANGFIACSAANCPAPTALPMESPAAAQANANGGSSGNPKAIGGSTKRSGSVTGLPPILSALLDPPTTGTSPTVGPVAHPSSSTPGTTPTTPAAGKTSSSAAPTTSKSATPKATTTTPTPTAGTTPPTVAPTTTPPTTVPPTTDPPTTVPPTTVPPTTTPATVDPTTILPTTILPTITISASLTIDPASAGPTSS